MVINLFIYGSIFIFSYRWLIVKTGEWTGASAPWSGFFPELFHILLIIIGFVLVLIFCYIVFTIFAGLINAPFYENISQLVEKIKTGNESANDLSFWRDFYISIKGEIQKIIFHAAFLILFFLLDLIPGAGNIISFSGWIVFSCYFNALDFLDYPMTRKRARFRDKLKMINLNKALNYGFGLTAFAMMLFPVVNVFMKPILVIAGTSLYFEKENSLN